MVEGLVRLLVLVGLARLHVRVAGGLLVAEVGGARVVAVLLVARGLLEVVLGDLEALLDALTALRQRTVRLVSVEGLPRSRTPAGAPPMPAASRAAASSSRRSSGSSGPPSSTSMLVRSRSSSFSVMSRNLPALSARTRERKVGCRRRRRSKLPAAAWTVCSPSSRSPSFSPRGWSSRFEGSIRLTMCGRRARRAPLAALRAPPRARSRCPSARGRPSTPPRGRPTRRPQEPRATDALARVELLEHPVPVPLSAQWPARKAMSRHARGGSTGPSWPSGAATAGSPIIGPNQSEVLVAPGAHQEPRGAELGTRLTPSVSAPPPAASRPRP